MTYENGTVPPRVSAAARNHWQDWGNLILAVWLFISPWVLAFAYNVGGTGNSAGGMFTAGMMRASWNAWIFGIIIALVAATAIGRLQVWEEIVNMLLGIWLFVAPWVLGFAGLTNAAWDHWVVGLLVFVLAVWDMQSVPRLRTGPATYR